MGGSEGANGVYNKLNKTFSGCLEEERRSAERAVISQVRKKGMFSPNRRVLNADITNPGLAPLVLTTDLWFL